MNVKTKTIIAITLGVAGVVQLALSLGHYFDGWTVNSAIGALDCAACFCVAIAPST